MPKLIVLYPAPKDPADFAKAFREEHAPLVKAQLPTVRAFEAGPVTPAPGTSTPFHWIAELSFDSLDALKNAVGSPGGLRAAGHARQISTGGEPTMLILDS